MGLVLGQSLMVISTTGIMLYAKVSPLYNVLWECIVVVYTKSTLFTNMWTHECTFSYQSVGVCEVSYTYLIGCLRYREKYVKDVCCCLQTCNSDVYVVVMGLVLGQSLMVISITGIMLYAKVSPLYNVLWECIVVVYTKSTLFTNIWTHECTFGYQSVGVWEVSYTYLLRCLRYREKHVKDVCCCLQTCNSVVYVVVMGLVLGQSLMVISTTVSCYMQKYLPFIMYYGSALLLFICKIHCLQTFEHMSALWAIKALKLHIHIN